MKIFRSSAALAVATVFISGCMKTDPASLQEEKDAPEYGKIINTSTNASGRSLLVQLADASDDISGLLGQIGADSMERAIRPGKNNTEKLSAYGLDRWYVVRLPEGCDIDMAAGILSGSEKVSAVQFNTILSKASDCRSWQYIPGTLSKSVNSPAAFADPGLGSQWHYFNDGGQDIAPTARAGADISVTDAWRLCAGDPGITVAVIDEAVQWDHPDLAANMWTNPGEIPGNQIDDDENGYVDDIYGINCTSGTSDLRWKAEGMTGHGTHVAGTVSAVNGNAEGVCGVAGGSGNNDGVRIMSCQIFDGFTGGDVLTSANAFIYAADNHADIAQCSFGYSGGAFVSDLDFDTQFNSAYALESQAMKYFMEEGGGKVVDGGIIIFAAGNEGYDMASYPGAYKGCISVTSIASDGLPAYYTNYGPGCDIAAPGGEYYTGGQASESGAILSTMPTESMTLYDEYGNAAGYSAVNYGYMQGTSMACPNVSGVAALGLSYALQLGKHFSRDEFLSMLLTSADGLDSRLIGSKRTLVGNQIGSLSLLPFKGNMGSGSVNAWKLLMQIEGTPVLTVVTGEEQRIALDDYFGEDSGVLKFRTVEIGEADMHSLGLQEKPYVKDGELLIRPTKTGSGKITVSALVGGDSEDSTDSPSALTVTKTISVISRNVKVSNGGWL